MICEHLEALTDIKVGDKYECEECMKIGSSWVHLRTCQTCGATLCCDSSPHRHARHHSHDTGHHVVASAEPGERWVYCFEDDQMAQY